MTDEELIEFATEFREGILDGRPPDMMCFAVCAPLEGLLRLHGVESTLVEGVTDECNHFWLQFKDGRVLDPTADQFNDDRVPPMPSVYLGPPATIHTME